MKPMSQDERRAVRQTITSKYQKEIDLIFAVHPRLEEQIDKQATEQAVKLLGVEKLVKQKESLEKQVKDLEKAIDIVEAQISEKMPKEKPEYRGSCPTPLDLCTAVSRKKAILMPAIKSKHATYKRVVKLEQERDEKLQQLEAISNRDQLAESGIL